MAKANFELRPALTSIKGILLYICLLCVLLTSPLWVPSRPREEHYRLFFDFEFMRTQIFESKTDIDIVFLGASGMGMAVDPLLVKADLSRVQPNPVVFMLATWSFGGDLYYQLLLDLLEHRKVKMLVIHNPVDGVLLKTPHPKTEFLDFKEAYTFDPDRPWMVTLLEYGSAMLGGLKRLYLWSTPVRPVNDAGMKAAEREANSLGTLSWMDMGGKVLISDKPQPPEVHFESKALALADAIYKGAPHQYFDAVPLTDPGVQYCFMKFVEACRRHGTKLVLMNLPNLEDSRPKLLVPDHEALRTGEVKLIGAPAEVLFAGLSQEQKKQLFGDPSHLNIRGMTYLTKAYLPSFVSLYEAK